MTWQTYCKMVEALVPEAEKLLEVNDIELDKTEIKDQVAICENPYVRINKAK